MAKRAKHLWLVRGEVEVMLKEEKDPDYSTISFVIHKYQKIVIRVRREDLASMGSALIQEWQRR